MSERQPAGHDQDAGELFVKRERGVYGQGASLREAAQQNFGGRHFGPGYLVVDEVVQLVHRSHYARLVFHFVLVHRRQVEPRGRREPFVQRQRYFFPANFTPLPKRRFFEWRGWGGQGAKYSIDLKIRFEI